VAYVCLKLELVPTTHGTTHWTSCVYNFLDRINKTLSVLTFVGSPCIFWFCVTCFVFKIIHVITAHVGITLLNWYFTFVLCQYVLPFLKLLLRSRSYASLAWRGHRLVWTVKKHRLSTEKRSSLLVIIDLSMSSRSPASSL